MTAADAADRLTSPSLRLAVSGGAAALLYTLLVVLHVTQAATADAEALELRRFRQARLDLAEGYAHLAGAGAGPYDPDRGLALLRQGVADARRVHGDPDADLHAAEGLGATLDGLEAALARTPPDPVQLRLAYSAAAEAAGRVDDAAEEALAHLRAAQDRVFVTTLGVGAALAALALGLLHRASEVARRAQAGRTEAEREQERLRDLVATVLEGTEDAVFVKDVGGRYLLLNAAGARMFERPAGAVVGLTDAAMFQPDLVAGIVDHDREVLATRRPSTRETVSPYSGAVIETTKTPLVDPDGTLLGIVGISRDITARRQAEVARRAEHERLAGLADTAPGVLLALHRGVDGRRAFAYASPRVRDLFGVEPAALAADAEPAFDRVLPEDRPALEEDLLRSAASGKAWRRVFRVAHPTRGVVHVEGHAAPVPSGTGLVWHGFFTDVTERVRVEEQLRQTAKMEAIGRLAGGVAHDFNNLLTVINAYAELLADDPDAPPAERRELVDGIREAGERATGLTAQLLAFGRKAIVQPVLLDPSARIGASLQLVRRLIGEDVTLDTDLESVGACVRVDPHQFDQILMNLAVNARDAMPTGGRVSVRVCRAEAGVEIAVTDTGAGIPEEVRAHVFEPFFTTKAAGRGTGLGLSVIHGIVTQAGGAVTVESEVGRGTTFRIRLPMAEGAAAPLAGPPPRTREVAANERLLLVEDDPAVRRITALMLENNGFRVIATGSAEEALTAAVDRPDALVTDVILPGRSGRELADQLRARFPGLPVLFLSGYTDDAVLRHGVEASQDRFLQKPFTQAPLIAAVRAALSGAR